jgi:hypothetical protein
MQKGTERTCYHGHSCTVGLLHLTCRFGPKQQQQQQQLRACVRPAVVALGIHSVLYASVCESLHLAALPARVALPALEATSSA